jgi:hypothetical protein
MLLDLERRGAAAPFYPTPAATTGSPHLNRRVQHSAAGCRLAANDAPRWRKRRFFPTDPTPGLPLEDSPHRSSILGKHLFLSFYGFHMFSGGCVDFSHSRRTYSGKKVLPWSAAAELLRLSACEGRSRLPATARVQKGDRLYAVSLSFSFLNIYEIYR